MSLCENNCEYYGYDSKTKNVICKCEIKTSQLLISEVDNNPNLLSNNFLGKSSSNPGTMKCYYTLFTIDGISKNNESYILMFIIILYMILSILFYKCGYPTICDEIIEIKEQTEKIINTNETVDKKMKKIKKIKKKLKNKKILKVKSNEKINAILVDSNNNFKSFSKFESQKKKILNNLENNYQNKENSVSFNDYELNSLYYKQALQYDKRSFFQYYISLLRTKHPLLLSFCPLNDYNSRIVKISIFLLFFSIIYTINGFFFLDNSIIHKIYENGGKYNFELSILYSFILSHIFYLLIKYIFLSERNLTEIKYEKNADKVGDKIDNIKRCLAIKYFIFYVVGILLLMFCWYYLSSFGAVFQNTQVYLIKNTIISLSFSFIYPFIINIFPGLFRIMSLRDSNEDKILLYKISKIAQFI